VGGANGTPGCKNPNATNYDPSAFYEGPCTFAPGQVLGAASSTEQQNGTSTAPGLTLTPVGQVLGATVYAFTRNLAFGSRGVDVTELQKILINEGFLKITNPTQYFGPLTRAALIKWQTSHAIPATGIFGALSRAFLLQ
jgi:peptidoglycan hydrolase-like protein with peptidoglycan-binding domain